MAQVQKIEFSPISRSVRLVLNLVIIFVMGYLSYGWSFRETQEFNILIFGTKYALAAAMVFQVGPNALLALRSVTSGKMMIFLVWSFVIGLNLIDFVTNGGQFYQDWQTQSVQWIQFYGIHPYVVQAAYIVGWVFCFAVTWFEEILLYLMGVSFHLLGLVYSDLTGESPPNWLMVDLPSLALAASGAPPQQSQQQKPQQQQGNQQKPQNQQRQPQQPHMAQHNQPKRK